MIVPVLASVVVASLVQYKEDSEMLLKVTSVTEHLEKQCDCCIPFFSQEKSCFLIVIGHNI